MNWIRPIDEILKISVFILNLEKKHMIFIFYIFYTNKYQNTNMFSKVLIQQNIPM